MDNERNTSLIKVKEQHQIIISKIDNDYERNILATAFMGNKPKYFCPNGAQERLINSVGSCTEKSNTPVILSTFGNGVGKSTTVYNIIVNIIFGIQNGWFDQPTFHNFHYPKTIWYCSTPTNLEENIAPELVEYLLPFEKYYKKRKSAKYYDKFEFLNGWTMKLLSYEKDPKQFEGPNVGMIICDEPAPEPIWKALKSRRRMGCIAIMVMTPLYCDPYVIEEIVERHDKNIPGYDYLKASVYDACKKRGVRGHLPADIVDSMVNDYDEEEREARANGEFMYFRSRIYPNIYREKHFRSSEEFPIKDEYIIIEVTDPKDGKESASIYMAYDPKTTRMIIFAELPDQQKIPYWKFRKNKEISDEIKDKIKIEDLYKIVPIRVIDKYFGFQTRGNNTIALLYFQEGENSNRERKENRNFTYIPSYSTPGKEAEIMFGHKRVRKQLENLEDGEPGLIIHNNCFHSWNGLTHYIKKQNVNKNNDKADTDQKIVEKFKDFPDVIRYGVCYFYLNHVLRKENENHRESKKDKYKYLNRSTNNLLRGLSG